MGGSGSCEEGGSVLGRYRDLRQQPGGVREEDLCQPSTHPVAEGALDASGAVGELDSGRTWRRHHPVGRTVLNDRAVHRWWLLGRRGRRRSRSGIFNGIHLSFEDVRLDGNRA